MSNLPDLDAMPKVMGDDGQFHATDEEVDLSGTPIEAWVALGFFWVLGATVFYQFFTRYVLNNSASWTEEIARYLLIAVVFTGATIGVAKNNHIQVDFFYKFMPQWLSKFMNTLVDIMRVGFFWGSHLSDLSNDGEAGQLQNDHRRLAHELGLWRGAGWLCRHVPAGHLGHENSLATRLHRVAAPRIRNDRPLSPPHKI